MISFFRFHELPGIKTKMITLYALNVTDILLTLLLCGTGLFIEANPVVAAFIDNTFFSLMLKLSIPAVLFAYLYIRMKKASNRQLKTANILINALLLVYVVINVSHMLWISVYYTMPSLLA